MNDDTTSLHPWIEPELEARLAALVLGEASDFEREELERLAAERPELALHRKRLETLHRMLREVATGESAGTQEEWKLAPERREAVLAGLGGEATAEKTLIVKSRPNRRFPWGLTIRVAACVAVMALVLGLTLSALPGIQSKAQRPGGSEARFAYDLATEAAKVPNTGVVGPEPGEISVGYANDYLFLGPNASVAPAKEEREAMELAVADRAARPPAPASPALDVGQKPFTESSEHHHIRTRESVAKSDELALRASEFMAEGDLERASDFYRNALDLLPDSPMAEPRRYAYTRQFSRSSSELAKQRAEQGRYPEAIALAEQILRPSVDPNNADAQRLLEQLADTERYSPSLSPQHLERVRRIKLAQKTAEGFAELGDSDQADREFDKALNQDHYNTAAARSGQEKNERYVLNSHDQTYNQTRARMLREVAEGWEAPVPESIRTESAPPDPFGSPAPSSDPFADPAAPRRAASGEALAAQPLRKRGAGDLAIEGGVPTRDRSPGVTEFGFANSERLVEQNQTARREDKLKSIVIPSVEFADTPLRDALQFLEERSAELDTSEPDPAKRGIRISTDSIAGASTESTGDPSGFGFEESAGGDVLDTKINLRLTNVPLAEALRYTTSLAQAKTRVDSDEVKVLPLSAPDSELYTNVYTVPPSFLSVASSYVGSGSPEPGDPFAAPSAEEESARAARMSARGILENAGITFPPGSSVVYNPVTSQLIVRNTTDQMELVEAFIEPMGMGSEVDSAVEDILALTPQVGAPAQSEPGSVRDEATPTPNTIDQLIAEAAGASPELRSEAPEIFGIAGVATEPAFIEMRRQSQSLRRPPPSSLDETSPETEPFSTFSLHVSEVSFQLAKAALASGKWPEAGQIRIEEFVNAFDYGDPVPSMDERVAARIDQAAHPFLQQRQLVRIALRTAEAGRSAATPLRLTLLLDNSGSMERPDRRETTRRALATLAGLLGEDDRVTLVSFARRPRLVAEAVPGHEAARLAETAATLPSEGGTNMGLALDLAFEKAREHFDPAAQNRIVMLTDGAANLGDADPESLAARVVAMRGAGIAFDAAGIGADGLNDEILAALARQGDGRYFLLDRPEDAEEGFAKQIAGALRPAAKNVKVQVEFDPARVKSYKLLGFEKHRLATEDFRDDSVDAAELAAAEAGVAVYQVEPDPAGWGDLGSVSVRFRDLENDEMVERRWPLPYLATAPPPEQGSDAIRLATVASQFAAKLAGGPLGDLVDLGELARLAAGLPHSERVSELREMIEQARTMEGADLDGYR